MLYVRDAWRITSHVQDLDIDILSMAMALCTMYGMRATWVALTLVTAQKLTLTPSGKTSKAEMSGALETSEVDFGRG